MDEATKAKLLTDSIKIRQAERLADLARTRQQSSLVQRLVRKTQDGTLGQPGEDAMGEDVIQLGDNHYTVQAPPAAGTNRLLPIALAIAAVLGGGGIGAVATRLLTGSTQDAVQQMTPHAVESAEPARLPTPPAILDATDLDTRYQLQLVD